MHPGETAASWMWDGFMRFLISEDVRAQALRRLFVFKIVPMINPDGVARGFYRADTRGTNLNRYYDFPNPLHHPTIFAIRTLLDHIHRTSTLAMYMDLHAHASKRGIIQFEKFSVVGSKLFFSRLLRICELHGMSA